MAASPIANSKAAFKAVSLRKLTEDLVTVEDQSDNLDFTVAVKGASLLLNFSSIELEIAVESSNDVYRSGSSTVVVRHPTGNAVIRFGSKKETNAFWSIVDQVIVKKSVQNAFDKRTDDTSAVQYFQFYSYLYQQQNMLQDHTRTSTYQSAFFQNYPDFAGKVVLDVGAGTGILSFFAVQAGATKVYSVEASNMALHCKELVKNNGYESIIKVVFGKIEEVELPEMVDVIISEPMGYLLYNERMLETYIHARKWLKPGGKMFPTRGDLYVCPFMDDALYMEQAAKSHFWHQQSFHGVDVRCLSEKAFAEYFSQPIVDTFDLRILMAQPFRHAVDFLTAKESDLENIVIPVHYQAITSGNIHGLAFWFDVAFIGSVYTVWLSTAPSQPLTHWYQVRCLFKQPLLVAAGDALSGMVAMTANSKQSYNIEITLSNARTRVTTKNTIDLKNAFYRYFGTPPQPPPGVNHESPAEKIAVQVQQLQTAGGNPVSMVNSQLGGTAVPVVTNGQVVLSQNAMMQGGVPMQTVPMSMHSTQSNPNQANHPRAS
jgi:histone-arginine methyltransferase CARM1